MKNAEPGTVHHGSHRSEDLVPAFLDVLEECQHPSAGQLKSEGDGLLEDAEYGRPFQTSDDSDMALSEWLNDVLWNAMEEVAPPGHYFGAHPGDGSDFGFWEFEKEMFA